MAAEILVALVGTADIGKTEHDTLLHHHLVLLLTALKMRRGAAGLVLD